MERSRTVSTVLIAPRAPSYKQPITIVAAGRSSSRKSSANRLSFQPDHVQRCPLQMKRLRTCALVSSLTVSNVTDHTNVFHCCTLQTKLARSDKRIETNVLPLELMSSWYSSRDKDALEILYKSVSASFILDERKSL